MKVTQFTKDVLRIRRERRRLFAAGYEEIGETGGMLWELHRGFRIGHEIIDVVIGPDRRTVFVKVAPTPARVLYDWFPRYQPPPVPSPSAYS